MPNCFQLIDKSTNEPAIFKDIDNRICYLLDIPVDKDNNYISAWYNVIGWSIAVNGLKLGSHELRDKVAMDEGYRNMDFKGKKRPVGFKPGILFDILEILEQYYTSNAFVQIGKR